MIDKLSEVGIKFRPAAMLHGDPVPANIKGIRLPKGYRLAELKALTGEEIDRSLPVHAVFRDTKYIGVDIDLHDEGRTDTEKKDFLENNIIKELFGQFEGYMEYSRSETGVHVIAYAPDIAKELNDRIGAVKLKFNDGFTIELFGGYKPFYLTQNEVPGFGDVMSDNLPAKIKAIIEAERPFKGKDTPKDRKPLELAASPIEKDAIKEFISRVAPDKENCLTNGYPKDGDPSKTDFVIAKQMLSASQDTTLVFHSLVAWMTKWRPSSKNPISIGEIEHKAKMAIEAVPVDSVQKTGGLMELLKARKKLNKALIEKAARAIDLAQGMVWQGTSNIIFGESGSGKTKMLSILMMQIAKNNPDKTIFYYGPDLSIDDRIDLTGTIESNKLDNFILDTDMSPVEFMDTARKYSKDPDLSNVIFIVDTMKKIMPLQQKGSLPEYLQVFRTLTGNGATIFFVHHTNKDGETISGVADVYQDIDNIILAEGEYDGEDYMRTTLKPDPNHRCRYRVGTLTFRMTREGFSYELDEKSVDASSKSADEKHAKKVGNLYSKVQEIVQGHFDDGDELNMTDLKKILREDVTYTGLSSDAFLSKEIRYMAKEGMIDTKKAGKNKHLLVPFVFGPIGGSDENQKSE